MKSFLIILITVLLSSVLFFPSPLVHARQLVEKGSVVGGTKDPRSGPGGRYVRRCKQPYRRNCIKN
ncbi:hypothetical protein G4B88_028455 [Cannabis sativa]|uniref:Uncharacterized protein n=1 Tax=Cannabis sativa TaxID=3483 RepID=A0A7J6E4I0_CANSA|nr:hypothetical protein G4B88_028455 [Cannabis sativa]